MNKPTKKKSEIAHKEESVFFEFSATLRIWGDGLDTDEITRTLGLTPTHSHRKSEQPHASRSKKWSHDMWSYQPPIGRKRPLHEHITALWDLVRPHTSYLRGLKQKFRVDVFCGYRSNSRTAGFEVDHHCLGLFEELEIPFGISVVIS